MARYYGTLQGEGEQISRTGRTRLYLTAQSLSGDIVVEFTNGVGADDLVLIYARQHGGGRQQLIYQGGMAALLERGIAKTLADQALEEEFARPELMTDDEHNELVRKLEEAT